jgi:hypothetical protein
MATSPALSDDSAPSRDDFYALAVALGANPDNDPFHFNRNGRRFVVKWRGAGKNTPPTIEISTDAGPLGQPQATHAATKTATTTEQGPFRAAPNARIPSPAPLTMRKETRLDRTGKSLRINRETQTGDAAFDERVYLESDAPDSAVLAALVDPTLRASVMKCLDLGAASVTLDLEGNLTISRPLPQADLLGVDKLTPLIDALGAAAEAIPPLVAVRQARPFAAKVMIAAVVSAVVSVPLFFLCNALWETVGVDLYTSCAIVGFLLWFLALPILILVQRGRSDSLRMIVTSAISLLFSLPVTGTDLALTLNGLFDTSPPVTHEQRVLSRRATSGKNTTYYVTLASWHPGEEKIELTVGSSLYYKLAEGAEVRLTTSLGALGWERLRHIDASGPRTWN